MRFSVIADTHFWAHGRGKDGLWWNRTLESRTLEIGEALVAAISEFEPDFVVHCGDLSGHCDMENFEAGSKIMGRLPCPWYAVIGNHDTWFPGVRDAFSDLYGLPRGQCYYTRSLGGLLFIFLDTCYWQAVDGTISAYLDKELFDTEMIEGLCVPPEELEWLREQLDAHRNETVCLVSHAPLGFKKVYRVGTLPKGKPAPKDGVSLPQFNCRCGRTGDVANRREVRRLLESYDNIRLALAGHCHINDLHREDRLAFCQTGAMREYPFEFRMVEVGDGVLSVTTHGLGTPRFSKDSFVEDWGNRWVAGTDEDRTFSVRL